ncbi:ATP-grasp domain-containing protein [Nocardioides albidus]|uniref:ATP-grasp domain-containing protein n=1 Tax=Nocardioides albidus TaxID=1517589 RepID=A0A5C4VLE3_9ACTN|nr:biotin carboxylase N-terminal domain-containing protein [Nocardioides albidus]TNM36366.1 ATP-grasp domain-containing protein [Nocardioides albidus]
MKCVFIANRGEIAARIAATVRAEGLRAVVAAPACDAGLPYTAVADECVDLASPRDFISVEAMLEAARTAGADTVHPGYGFLSEDARFARACTAAGLTFVGPDPATIALMGDKSSACRVAHEHGVPVLSAGHDSVEDADTAEAVAAEIGLPVMLKAVAGGGGMGMAVARTPDEVADAFRAVSSRGTSLYQDPRVLIERWVERARHIEVQVMGLPDGRIVTMAPRDCSVQRRHQKVVEETPAPGLTEETADRLARWATALATAVSYRGAGTVEFLLDTDSGEAFFLEMNTRLQVEHRITEAVHTVDLVAWQLAVARGESVIPDGFTAEPAGHAFELRIYAEDPVRFLPKPGRITTWDLPVDMAGVLVDAGYAEGTEVTPFFDPLMAKLVTTGPDRAAALRVAQEAVAVARIEGPGQNLPFLARVLQSAPMVEGRYDTGIVRDLTQPA